MFFDIAGWIGMGIVLLAYVLLSTNRIKNGMLYQGLNLVAGVLMAIGLFPKDAWFSFALQVVWAAVAAVTILKLMEKGKKKTQR